MSLTDAAEDRAVQPAALAQQFTPQLASPRRPPLQAAPTSKLGPLLALTDLVAIAVAFVLGAALADATRVIFDLGASDMTLFLASRAQELMLLAVLTVCIFAFGGLYRRTSWEVEELRRIAAGIALIAMFDATLQHVTRDHNSRLWFAFAYPLAGVMVVFLRMALRSLPSIKDATTNHIVLIGGGTSPETLIYQMRGSRSSPVKLLTSLPLSSLEGRSAARVAALLDRLILQRDVPTRRVTIILAPGVDELGETQEAVQLLEDAGWPCSIVLPLKGLARRGLSLQNVVGADVVMAELSVQGPTRLAALAKGFFDRAVGLVIIALLAPVLLTLSAILLAEGGPVFFRQLRVGKGGRRFWCYKFRSMRPDAQERLAELLANDPEARAEWNTHQKLADDPRVTKVGHFLRKTSLDELPQLFNVLTGEMSLVGPRPIIAPEVDGYEGDKAYFYSPEFEYYKACKPGITGLWQVSGRSDSRHDERVRLDRWYARNRSFWLDLVILMRTVRVVLFREGSV